MRALLFISVETEVAVEQARVNNPCERVDAMDEEEEGRRQWLKLSEISVQLETEGRSSSAPFVGWAREGEGKRKAGG